MSTGTEEKVLGEKTVKVSRTTYVVKLLSDDRDNVRLLLSKKTTQGELVDIIAFYLHYSFSNHRTSCPENVVGICDSYSADAGEVAYQMFTPKVKRRPYAPGRVYIFNDYKILNEKLLTADWSLISIAVRGFLKERLESAAGSVPVYFIYIGNDSMFERDKYIYNRFKNNHFAVFRCVNGLCTDEQTYIALYSSDANTLEKLEAQRDTKEYPKKLPGGYKDYRRYSPRDFGEEDLYFSTTETKSRKWGTTSVEIGYFDQEDCGEGHSFVVCIKEKGAYNKRLLFRGSFSLANFTLENASILDYFGDKSCMGEVGTQLFYPPVQRKAYPLGTIVLLSNLEFNEELTQLYSEYIGEMIADSLHIIADAIQASVDDLNMHIDPDAYFDASTQPSFFLAYLGDLGRPAIEQLKESGMDEWEIEDEKNALYADNLIYSALKDNPTCGMIRCIRRGKSNFGENNYIAYLSPDIPIMSERPEEFPQPKLKKDWLQELEENKNTLVKLSPSRSRRFRWYRPDYDVCYTYILRDMLARKQSEEMDDWDE